MIIQIIGLPGSGKTALASYLADRLNAIHFNADEVRADLNKDLGFSPEARIEQARRMGALARLTSKQGYITIVDFICPTQETREAFGKPDIFIWVNRINKGRFEDTNAIWQDPIDAFEIKAGLTIEKEAQQIIDAFDLYDWKAPTTLMLGRYQPWHEGHQALWEKANEKTGQTVIGVRHTQGTSEKDPLSFGQVTKQIVNKLPRPFIVKMPNITNIVYGRDVGYKIEQIELDANIQAISATQKRKEMGL